MLHRISRGCIAHLGYQFPYQINGRDHQFSECWEEYSLGALGLIRMSARGLMIHIYISAFLLSVLLSRSHYQFEILRSSRLRVVGTGAQPKTEFP